MGVEFKEIFVFVAGTTPQIITETIYALSQKNPPVYPNEIFIITTLTGKKSIEKSLIDEGVLDGIAREYAIPSIPVTESSFIIPRNSQNIEIDDIRSDEENELMGNVIMSLIRDKTQDSFSRLHCSIAGGRKTMSFYLGAVLQLFGRTQDRLYHVLVSPEFESNPSFFYKPKKNIVIEGRGVNGITVQLNTKDAVIELAELPFIRLRDKLSLQGKSFKDLVFEGQKEIDTAAIQPEIVINLSERTIYIGAALIEMVPVQIMIYTAFIKQKIHSCQHPERPYCLDCTDCYKVLTDFISEHAIEDMAGDYKHIYGNSQHRYIEFLAKWKGKIGIDVFRQNISKINRALIEQIEEATLLPYYLVNSVRQYGSSKYGVKIEKGKIRFE